MKKLINVRTLSGGSRLCVCARLIERQTKDGIQSKLGSSDCLRRRNANQHKQRKGFRVTDKPVVDSVGWTKLSFIDERAATRRPEDEADRSWAVEGDWR